jgi:hypothetical protein
MAAAHWLCAVESGTHAQAVAVGVRGTAWCLVTLRFELETIPKRGITAVFVDDWR